jgi:hypothetical protein
VAIVRRSLGIVPSRQDGSTADDVGFLFDDVTGEAVGLYAQNDSEDTLRIVVSHAGRTFDRMILPGTLREENLPVAARIAERIRPPDASHPVERRDIPYESFSCERIYANPVGNSPTVLSVTEQSFNSNTTGHSVTRPATVDPDDGLLTIFAAPHNAFSANSFSSPGDMTERFDDQWNLDGDRHMLGVFAKVATGSEDGGTTDITTAVACGGAVQTYRLQAGTWGEDVAAVIVSTAAMADETANADPPDHTPGGGSADRLWFAVAAWEGGTVGSSPPTNYTNHETTTSTVDDGVGLSVSRRGLDASSENPGTYTSAAEHWIAVTISVEPTGVATDTVSLFPTVDGTKTDVVDEGDATSDLFASIDDDPASPSDSDWNNNTDDAGQAFYELTDMPSDFDEADSTTITVRYRGAAYDGSGTVTLFARLYQSDESTPLSDEVQVAQVTADSSFANTSPVTLTGIVASDKTTWDGARLRLRWART